MAEPIIIDGKPMKKCPGWEGNSFRCGRGNPRLIAETAEVCENCSRGMRKRGQKTREEQEQAERKERERIAKLERGVAALEARLDAGSSMGAKVAVAGVLRALDGMREEDVDPTTYWKGDGLGSNVKMEILRHFAGVEEPVEKRRGYYR